jgi:predicted O-methyltransferase YrrM
LSRPSIEFLLYLAGRSGPQTALTAAEGTLLKTFARGRTCVVEVGVHHGATSAGLASVMAPAGRLWLIDPYVRHTWPERLMGFSFAECIARRSVRPWADRIRFIRLPSTAAASQVSRGEAAQLIFIDADHSYESVRADLFAWAPCLANSGALAFHDSRPCPGRPELDSATGPVRLVDEMLRGEHGTWSLVAEADSLAILRRGTG